MRIYFKVRDAEQGLSVVDTELTALTSRTRLDWPFE